MKVLSLLQHGLRCALCGWFGLAALAPLRAEVLLRYDMTTNAPSIEEPFNGLDGRALTVGNAVETFNLPAAIGYATAPVCQVSVVGSVLPLDTAAAALAADAVLELDFQVGWNVGSVDLATLTFDVSRGGASTNRGFGVYVTTPRTADVLAQGSTYVLAQRFNWDAVTVNLAGIAGLQGLAPGDFVRIKIPFWTTAAGQFLEFDNLTVNGTVHPRTNAPAPPVLSVLNAQRQSNSVSLTWAANPGSRYRAEFSPDLRQWSPFPTNHVATGATVTVTLDTAYTNLGVNVPLLHYAMGQAAPQTQGTAQSALGGNLVAGPGVNTFNLNFAEYSNAPSLFLNFEVADTNLAAAFANGNYFAFTVTAGSNVAALNLTALEFNAARGGAATPRGYGVYATTATVTNLLVQPATTIDTVRPVWDPQSVNLAAVSALQNLGAGQRVTFTVAGFVPSTNNSLEFDDLVVRGTITPTVLPRDGGGKLFLRLRELEADRVPVSASTKPTGAVWNAYATRTLDQLPSYLRRSTDGALSEFGGLLSVRTNGTGFFRPIKRGDRWWLVDPQGYLFLHQGVAVIGTINSTGAVAALQTSFGTPDNWALAATSLLREQRFNGAGAWSDTTRLKAVPGPLAYTVIANFLGTYSATNTAPGFPQVFGTGFSNFCAVFAQRFAATRNDPNLIGYFSDNELDFPLSLLGDWLALAAGNASYDEAWRWLRERYGPGATTGNVTAQDRLDFLGHVWGQYYRLVNQAIKQQDTNHLYLGSRLFSSDKDRPEIFRAIGPHVDVLSVNHYSQWTPDIERIRMWEREAGRPVIITEFYVKGADSGMPNNTGAGWVVQSQAERGAFYQNFVLALLESRVCVGWHWFKYADNDPDVPGADPSNIDSNKGVVSNRYVPYTPLLDAMRELNERTYRLADYFDTVPTP